MGILMKKILSLFFIYPVILASNYCEFSWCEDRILIRFPFQLQSNQLQRPYCGYPGFKLICMNDTKTVLDLPFSGEFYVRNINYLTQQIQVYDPDHCLPKRLLSLNLSGTPFVATLSRNYTFLSCKSSNAMSRSVPIDCLSNSTYFVSAVPSVDLANNSLPDSCKVIGRLSFPFSSTTFVRNIGDDLTQDLQLTWNKPDCRVCESQGLLCGFESNTSDRISCSPDYHSGGTSRGLLAFRIITLSIVGPACTFAIVLACCVCHRDRVSNAAAARRAQQLAAITPHPPEPPIITTLGLDETTIESYEKLVLGESKRVPGPNDGSCWICLAEYNSKETIRCIPECKHCFHSDCIDEWLRMNSTCPVCRNTPTPSPSHDVMSNTAP
ncbi:hypothetical protein PIB30_038732 [Stylosanthes scabra]|uniref:RING-type E3 ubiquitin transferase n=1 Tax=Stylosanthes scabra TaxID=79078 RepID=A0ABU6TDY4_9FABA|nr:hypothetical protein [Stylosanthes scabra]